MTPLRAGVIGFGYMGRLHLAAYQQAGVNVTGIADTRADALAMAANDLRRYENYLDLLGSDIDLVSICLPTALHYRVTLDAVEAGKHILLEKPVAISVRQAERMSSAARARGVRLFVGMTHRFYPEVKEAKQIVESGGIGDIVMIRDCILEHFGFLDSPRWYLERERAGGGTVLSSGIHMVDRVLWFLGEPPASVAGTISNRFFGAEVEDGAQMALRFRSGRSAQITFGLLAESHPLVCDLEIIGTRGSIVVHTWQGYEYRSREGIERREIYTNEPHVDKVLVGICGEVQEICTAICGRREPRPSAEESTQALRVIEAFYRAAETGDIERLS